METLQSPPPPINASTTSSTTTTSNTSSQTATTSTDGGQGLGLQLGLAGTNDGPRATGMTNQDVSAPSLTSLASPGIKVELHHGASDPALSSQHQHQHQHQQPATAGAAHDTTGAHDAQPPLAPHPRSAPAVQQFQSPMRQHKRTPSQHREVKETLNARSEYTSDDVDGRSHHAINQYTIMEEIGRGSYGAVHRAADQFGNDYAVKEFSKTRLRKRAQSNILRRGPRRPGRLPFRAAMGAGPGPGMDPTVSSQLSDQKAQEAKDALFWIREEIAIMKKLNHPSLVSLIEVLDDPEEDSLYMVLEMCKKGVIMNVGLDEVATPYSEEECRCWFRDLILGIEYLHAQGVVHRDIKPDNLLLTDDDVLKIVDFGVSEMFEKPEQMRTAKSAGSPAFLPPELCVARHGDVSGTAADIWSMGVTLYCLRYGKIPFNRSGVLEMYEAITTEAPAIPEDENPNLKDLLLRLMEKDPEKRITMPLIREHPWVTKEGADPLLSAEENCSDLVDDPNELEVNHAFTRRMSHLLCVMKAISNFKALLPSRSRLNSPRLNLSPEDATTPTHPHHFPHSRFRHKPKPSMDEQEMAAFKLQNEEHAARLMEERARVLQHRRNNTNGALYVVAPPAKEEAEGELVEATETETEARAHGEAQAPATAPPVLGIGTGGHSQFKLVGPADEPPSVVADSPTAVDFNVYDRAYEEELQRIKRAGGRPNVYMTRHVNSTERFKAEGGMNILEERHGEGDDEEEHRQRSDHHHHQGGGGGAGAAERGSAKGMVFKPNRFADLVAQTIKDSKNQGSGP